MSPRPKRPSGIAFGHFQALPDHRDLLADGRPIRLRARGFDVLMALIEVPEATVNKDTLMARVWPIRTVGESKLSEQIGASRRALGSERGLIVGHGYQFTRETRPLSPAMEEAPDVTAVAAAEAVPPPTNLPEQVTGLIGRQTEFTEVLALLGTYRFINLTGPGGIDTTRLTVAVARHLREGFPDGVWIAELSAIAGPHLVSTTVAAAVGLQPEAGVISPQTVSQALAHRRLLLIPDTCEHVVVAAAAMVEVLLNAVSEVRIIAIPGQQLR